MEITRRGFLGASLAALALTACPYLRDKKKYKHLPRIWDGNPRSKTYVKDPF